MIKLLIYIFLTSIVLGCKRQPLEEPYQYLAYIPISIDWSKSDLLSDNIYNVSVVFYSKDGDEPIEIISGDENFLVAQLPVGQYSTLIYNETVNDIGGVIFENSDSYDGISAKLIKDISAGSSYIYYAPTDSDNFAFSHEQIATWSLDDFEVTEQMVKYTRTDEFADYIEEVRSRSKAAVDDESTKNSEYSSVIDESSELTKSITKTLENFSFVEPLPATAINTVTLEVVNLSSVMSIEAVLKGSATGAMLSTRQTIHSDSLVNVYNVEFSSTSYDESSSNKDGSTTGQFITFGKQTNGKYELYLSIVVSSGELFSYSYDVTDQVEASDDHNISIIIKDITLPEGSDTGFGVGDWEDSEDLFLQ
ncbi:MAG: DUF5119 domain-containing protein [Rikenellaceae bacterium]